MLIREDEKMIHEFLLPAMADTRVCESLRQVN